MTRKCRTPFPDFLAAVISVCQSEAVLRSLGYPGCTNEVEAILSSYYQKCLVYRDSNIPPPNSWAMRDTGRWDSCVPHTAFRPLEQWFLPAPKIAAAVACSCYFQWQPSESPIFLLAGESRGILWVTSGGPAWYLLSNPSNNYHYNSQYLNNFLLKMHNVFLFVSCTKSCLS